MQQGSPALLSSPTNGAHIVEPGNLPCGELYIADGTKSYVSPNLSPRDISNGVHTCRADNGTEQGEWMQGGGWRAWVVSNAKPTKPSEARNEIDRLRAELRGDFRSALRHAYLGPR